MRGNQLLYTHCTFQGKETSSLGESKTKVQLSEAKQNAEILGPELLYTKTAREYELKWNERQPILIPRPTCVYAAWEGNYQQS